MCSSRPSTTYGALTALQQPRRQRRDLVRRRARVGADDHELVAAQPRGQVAAPDRRSQALGDRAQQLVARPVAERVVDHLEAVQVQQQQRQAALAAAGGRDRLLDVRRQVGAVRQAGQRVLERLDAQLVLDPRAVQRRAEHVGRGLQEAVVLGRERRARRVATGDERRRARAARSACARRRVERPRASASATSSAGQRLLHERGHPRHQRVGVAQLQRDAAQLGHRLVVARGAPRLGDVLAAG